MSCSGGGTSRIKSCRLGRVGNECGMQYLIAIEKTETGILRILPTGMVALRQGSHERSIRELVCPDELLS